MAILWLLYFFSLALMSFVHMLLARLKQYEKKTPLEKEYSVLVIMYWVSWGAVFWISKWAALGLLLTTLFVLILMAKLLKMTDLEYYYSLSQFVTQTWMLVSLAFLQLSVVIFAVKKIVLFVFKKFLS